MDEYVAILADILREGGGALTIIELGTKLGQRKKPKGVKGKMKVILQRYPEKFALEVVQIKNGQSFMVHLVTRQDHAFANEALWPMFRSLLNVHRNYAANRMWPNSLNQFVSEFEGYTGLGRDFAKHEAYNPMVAQGYVKKANSKLVWDIAKIQDCINQMPGTIKLLKLGASTSADALSEARASPFPTSGSMLSLLDGIGGNKSNNKAWKLKVPGSPSEEVRCIYVADAKAMEACILSDLALQASGMDDIQFVAIDCEGVPESLELLQVATEQGVYIFDAKVMGETAVCEALEPLLTSPEHIKLMHDLHKDAVALDKFGKITLKGTLDTQLVGEQVFGEVFLGMNAFLKKLELPQHPSKEFTHARMKAGVDLFAQRPIARTLLEYSAWDVGLLIRAVTPLQKMLKDGNMLKDLVQASDSRAATAMANGGARAIAFDLNDDFRIASADLLRAIRPNDGYFGERLIVESETDDVISLLPEKYRDRLELPKKGGSSELLFGFLPVLPNNSEDEDRSLQNEVAENIISLDRLSDIVLDTGRRPQCWVNEQRVFLCDDESELVSEEDLNHVANRLGRFGSDNRAGLNGKLHRFSAMRNREGDIAGITIRIGRNVVGNAAMLMDLLMGTDKSILILGEPGSGKSTIIREATRKLAESTNVIVVDTSNEIAGDGNVPHSCIGLARRMMVPSLDKQSDVMVEAVQNHTPNTMVIDEIGRPKEVMAARTVKQRGVRMIASAHGDLRKLLKNKDLRGLVGGVEVVTMGDAMAKEEAKRKEKAAADQNGDKGGASFSVSKTKAQRSAEPTFEVIVEVRRGARNEWKVTTDSAKAVDAILDGLNYRAQLRTRDPETGHMFLDLIES